MNLGYCTLTYEPKEFSMAIAEIAKAGYNGIEIYPKDWEWALSKQTIEDVRKDLTTNGLSVSAVFGGCLSSTIDLDGFARAVDIGSKLGSEFVFFVAAGKETVKPIDFAALCREASRIAKSKAMTSLLHNHAGTIVETSLDAASISKVVGSTNFGLCFDSVHYALFEDDLAMTVSRVKDYVKYVHLKDIKKGRLDLKKEVPLEEWRWGKLEHLSKEYTGLEEGVIDNRLVVKSLLERGYKGWWVVEIERVEYERSMHAAKNIVVLRGYLSKYGFAMADGPP